MAKERFLGEVAHIRQVEGGGILEHPLDQHLEETAALAASFAEPFNGQAWAYCAGLWHDLGKYQPAFQAYIRDKADPEAHIENAPGRVDHSTVGALYAKRQWGTMGHLLAYLIAGHHAGLTDFEPYVVGPRALKSRLHRAEESGLLDFLDKTTMPPGLLDCKMPQEPSPGEDNGDRIKGLHLWLRMLYSCLTDADFLDTEGFMSPEKQQQRGGFPTIVQLLERFDSHMKAVLEGAAPTPVNRIRAEVYRNCRKRAQEPPGVFSLTVPTGGGKTLSSLGFALEHAHRHGKQRVIYVIPYTSIIEQTADVFRNVFDDMECAVVEHHSSAEIEPDREDHNSRLACENWDAPLVVTTSVQFFESLFAARSSRCRKLHNIVDSVVILDEAQLLPPEFRQMILDSLNRLVRDYGVTLVICTATQPELGSVESFQLRYRGLPEPMEISPDCQQLHTELKRVVVVLPSDLNTQTAWPELADELIAYDSFLCIVNKRQDCRDLHALLQEGTYHLSALMCGQHRADTIKSIRADLEAHKPTRVVSTQLVEAGVDLDFPVVYRAMAGLDSIAQAAGRCNREGRLGRLGLVKVFVPPTKNFGHVARAEEAAREILHGYEGDVLQPELFPAYFRCYYHRIDPDKAGLAQLLSAQGTAIQFRTAADKFRLIDDSWQETVFVGYDEKGWALLGQLRRNGPERWLMRKMQRYAVNINARLRERLQLDGFIEEPHPGIYIQNRQELYDPIRGLEPEPRFSAGSMVK